MPDLSQRTVGIARNALLEMQPEETYTTYELRDFWKQTLFDAGFPLDFIEVAQSYHFNWTDIIPDLYTGKFGPRNQSSAYNLPPATGEQFLKKLVHFALSVNDETFVGQQLLESLEADGFSMKASVEIVTPTELARLPDKESMLRDLALQIQNGKVVSVVFVDLDNFKQVNDEHGHSEGDKCLIEVVALVCAAILGKGKLYRVGGDEFCIGLPNFYSFEAAATAERVRRGVEALKQFGGTTKVTTSIGVADSSAEGLVAPESLVKAADDAMYISKWTTKNRVTIWPPSDSDRQWAKENRERAKSREAQTQERQVQNPQTQFLTQDTNQDQEKERKREARTKLAAFLTEGQGIRNSLEYNNSASVYEKTEWGQRVEKYLSENLDHSYAVRFRSPTHEVTAYPSGINSPMRVHWGEVKARMAMLNDFISELRD